jgi:hypothetical protein
MVDHITACLVALLIGLIAFVLAGLSYWFEEALLTPGHVRDITREGHPFWFWCAVVVYIVIGILFIYGGVDGLIHGPAS